MALFKFNFLELAKKRKTTYEFSSKPVSDKNLNLILEAGRWAPSCSNLQPWHFIVIKDPKTINKLLSLCSFVAYHTNPPVIIALTLEACDPKLKLCGKGKIDDYMSIAKPALNMVYQAETLGIDSCYLSPLPNESEKIIRTPKNVEIAILVGLGYEKPNAFQRKRVRKQLSEIVFHERYGQK